MPRRCGEALPTRGVRHRRLRAPDVGWRVSASLRTDFVLDALEQAIYDRCSVGVPEGSYHVRFTTGETWASDHLKKTESFQDSPGLWCLLSGRNEIVSSSTKSS
jgi:hypothetical protein